MSPHGDGNPERILSTLEAAEAEDRLAESRAMRRRIAQAIDDERTPARDLAALTRRQMEIGREIESLVARLAEEASDAAAVADQAFDPETI